MERNLAPSSFPWTWPPPSYTPARLEKEGEATVLSSGFAWPALGEPLEAGEDRLCIPDRMGSTSLVLHMRNRRLGK